MTETRSDASNGYRESGNDDMKPDGCEAGDRREEVAVELIRRLQDGDRDAVDDLVRLYSDPVYAFIYRMMGDADDADDLFQETWIRAVRALPGFRGESKLTTWLYRIAMNCCRDAARSRARRPTVPLEEVENLLARDPDVDPIRLLTAREVRTMLAELPQAMREVVVLKFYHDLTETEIASIAGCPEGTVKSRLFRAAGILREKWTKRQQIRPVLRAMAE